MECACIDAEIDDYSEVLFDKIVTARKNHQCDECENKISTGEPHRFEKTVSDGHFNEYHTCIDCNSVRDHLVCSFYYGEIWDLVYENICEFGDQQPWARIGRLSPIARDRVCKMIEDSWNSFN